MTFQFEKERLTAFSPEGIPLGSVVFPRIRPGLVNITQVNTYPASRGQDIKAPMLEALLDHLTAAGQKAALSSPYAQQYVSRHPQWKAVLPGSIHFENH